MCTRESNLSSFNREIILICVINRSMLLVILVHKIDVTVFQPGPILVDMSDSADVEIRGYLAADYKAATFNIGRAVDTGPGDVGDELVDPSEGGIPTSNLGFPRGSRVSYYDHITHKRISVILEGINEKKERIGTFYITAEDKSGNSVKITNIIRAARGNFTVE